MAAERRRRDIPVAVERRHRPGRPPLTCHSSCVDDGDFTDDEWEFCRAVQAFKERGHPFPSWREVYRIFVGLGYRKAAPPRVED